MNRILNKLSGKPNTNNGSGLGNQTAERVKATALSEEETITVKRSTVEELIKACKQMATGDMEARVINISEDDRLYELVESFNASLDLMDAFIRESAAAIEHCSRDKFYRPLLPQGLPGAFGQSATIINKGGIKMRESHGQFQQIAEISDENTSSITTIASACEEMGATNEEIARHAETTVEKAHSTNDRAHELDSSVEKMSGALGQIDSTVEMIDNIADQTHLLALNAMIEASRAGGKGTRFEVVATEVKELAKSTTQATDRIRQQVMQFHSIAEDTKTAFQKIEGNIDDIESVAKLINTSLSHQVAATQEVTFNINDVAKNMEVVTRGIRDASSF